ncbi:MAG: DUF1513 domain-containing protein [Pseudomonadota bacterium]
MAIDRRSFLALSAALAQTCSLAIAAPREKRLYLGAHTDKRRQHGASVFDEQGELIATFTLPARGHGAALDPKGRFAVLFARRPGTFAAVIDLSTRQVSALVESSPDRHFYGHGCFSADGSVLYATENDFDGERGTIGIYAANEGFRRIGEYASGGIGPHEMLMLPGGGHLLVANGGILTHPSMGRTKLNLDDMRPNLAILRASDGELINRTTLPGEFRQLSLRHAAVSPQGRIAVGGQWEGDMEASPPLVLTWNPGTAPSLHEAPAAQQQRMKNYCGSVAFDRSGRLFAASCPRGNVISLWTQEGAFVRLVDLADSSGVAAEANSGFVASSGSGHLSHLSERGGSPAQLRRHGGLMWDNHLTAISG